jgi:glycosyltransferase involved in cell wall biosynthesis
MGRESRIILVDNGSEDSTRAIALKYGCKVIEDPYSSLGKTRNVGARSSSGLILGFLDADCLVDPKWISYCLSNFSNDKVSMVGTRAILT